MITALTKRFDPMAKGAVALFAAPEVLNAVSEVVRHVVDAESTLTIPDRWKPAIRLVGLVLALFAKSIANDGPAPKVQP